MTGDPAGADHSVAVGFGVAAELPPAAYGNPVPRRDGSNLIFRSDHGDLGVERFG
jgi:hypothetical protein